MLDIRWMRENREALASAMQQLNDPDAPWKEALDLDEARREVLTKVEALRAERNSGSKEIGLLFRKKKVEEANVLKARMVEIGDEIAGLDVGLREIEAGFEAAMLRIPNPPEDDVPVAPDEEGNVVVKQSGEIPVFDFEPQPHWDLGENLDIIDLERGARISGSRFYVLKGAGAQLQRALVNLFIDHHVLNNGYEEIYPPFMVRKECMTGTGNLPKFGDVLYRDAEEDYWFIPTAEVPVTNLHRGEIIEQGELPYYYVAHTPCFRREKVSAGKDVRGIKRVHQFEKVEMVKVVEPEHGREEDYWFIPTAEVPVTNLHRGEIIEQGKLPYYYVAHTPCFRREKVSAGKDVRGIKRVHQFEKVEMVKVVEPEHGREELESLTQNAEELAELLGLPWRRVAIATGDLSFVACKKYDIEVWAAGCGEWLEVSSCSWFRDFQARRMNTRFRREDGKTEFVHTLNGSGLALPRIVIAILENYQQADGSVVVPEALRPYMHGKMVIAKDED